jgi:molecular chaperone GrpE
MREEKIFEPETDGSQKEAETNTSEERLDTNQALDAARAEATDYKDRWMRAQAEFQNYRKRNDRERVDMRAMAAADIILQLLPVLDDFDRAFKAVPPEMRSHPWIEGFRLIERKFKQILDQSGVTTIETIGKRFDPNFHESAADEESDQPHGTILEEYRRGYVINDKVLRPAMVKIAK